MRRVATRALKWTPHCKGVTLQVLGKDLGKDLGKGLDKEKYYGSIVSVNELYTLCHSCI